MLVIDPELSIATCGQTFIPLSTAQVRMLVARWPGTRRWTARAVQRGGTVADGAGGAATRLRERFAAARLATLLAERKGGRC